MNGGQWPIKSLGAIGNLLSGQSPPSSAVNRDGKGTAYVSGPEQWDGQKLHVDKWTTEPKRMAPNGSIFITVKGAGVGKIFPGTEAAIGRDIYAFVPNDELLPRYLEHALRNSVQDVLRHAAGDIPGLSRKHILDHRIPVPSPPEQERIVAELEKQFSRLDEAVANLKRVKANLKRYKALVLKASVEGSMAVSQVRGPGSPADALLREVLAERRVRWRGRGAYREPVAGEPFSAFPLPEGWTSATIEQVAWSVEYGSSAKTSEAANGVPVLRMGNIIEGEIDPSELKYLPSDHDEFPRLLLEPGDLLFNRTNSPELVGKTAVFRSERRCSFASYLIRVRTVSGCVPEFVAAYINSAYGRRWVKSVVTQQVGQANVNGTKLQALVIPLPPIEVQQRIVDDIGRRLSIVREVDAEVEATLRHAETMRQATLGQAFSQSSR